MVKINVLRMGKKSKMLRIDYEPPKVYKIKYIIASATNFPDLHDKVNKLLSEGWIPQGGHRRVQRIYLSSDG